MGFMGLNHWEESDMAADLFYVVNENIIKNLEKGLKDPGNSYNTPGYINVGFYLGDVILPSFEVFSHSEKMYKLVEKTYDLLEQNKKDWKEFSFEMRTIKRKVKRLKLLYEIDKDNLY